jgi:hypothetical protein
MDGVLYGGMELVVAIHSETHSETHIPASQVEENCFLNHMALFLPQIKFSFFKFQLNFKFDSFDTFFIEKIRLTELQ